MVLEHMHLTMYVYNFKHVFNLLAVYNSHRLWGSTDESVRFEHHSARGNKKATASIRAAVSGWNQICPGQMRTRGDPHLSGIVSAEDVPLESEFLNEITVTSLPQHPTLLKNKCLSLTYLDLFSPRRTEALRLARIYH